MSEKSQARLLWQGPGSLSELREIIQEQRDFALELPPDFHFALFRHLYPDADANQPDQVDVSGGLELISQAAEVQGLEELAELASLLENNQPQVYIKSPGPVIQVEFVSET